MSYKVNKRKLRKLGEKLQFSGTILPGEVKATFPYDEFLFNLTTNVVFNGLDRENHLTKKLLIEEGLLVNEKPVDDEKSPS